MDPANLLAAMKRTVEQLAAFNEIAKALTSTLEVREVLALVMQKVSELLRPGNWSLLLKDEVRGDLYFEIAVGHGADTLKTLRLRPGEGVAGAVFVTGEPRCVRDVQGEEVFSRRFDRASTFVTGSVMAVPLKVRGRVLGVIELVSREGTPPFSEDDLRTLVGIADYAAIAIDNARNFKRVQELTLTDEHTGLYNARHLRAELDHEVARAARFRHPLSLVFVDLDRFKAVNDTHGHLVGSALLREVGAVLALGLRQVDSAFRYGGDEFALLLIETDATGACEVARKTRDRLREQTFLLDRGLQLKLTASFGVATFPEDGGTTAELLEAADKAMYRVKAAGRDGVLGASEPGGAAR